jgi:hypothetical protein
MAMCVLDMIRPTIQITDSGNKEFEDLIKRLNDGKEAYVTVGVHEEGKRYAEEQHVAASGPRGRLRHALKGFSPPPLVSEVALWNEFGTKTVPERSFIRSTVNESESKRNDWYVEMVNNIMEAKWTLSKVLEAIGFRMRELIRNKIKSNVPPPYGTGKKASRLATYSKFLAHEKLIAKRQEAKNKKWPGTGNKTLIASRTLLNSVGYKVYTS